MNYPNQFRSGAIDCLLKDWLLMIKHATRSVNFKLRSIRRYLKLKYPSFRTMNCNAQISEIFKR